jgi:hypothetical protein
MEMKTIPNFFVLQCSPVAILNFIEEQYEHIDVHVCEYGIVIEQWEVSHQQNIISELSVFLCYIRD